MIYLQTAFVWPFKFLLSFTAWLFSWLIPNRGKRILFAASLYTHLNRIEPSELADDELKAYLDEINRLFQLTGKEHRALVMPMLLHETIWGRIPMPDETMLTKRTVQSNCEVLLKSIPRWLRYDQKVMRDDLMVIVRRCAGRRLRVQHV
jgi:hypothetical protein